MGDGGGDTILIAGPPFRGYINMVADAFRASGLEPSVLEWQYPTRNLVQEALYYSSKSFRTRFGEAQDRRNAKALEKAVLASAPSFVLVLKAVELTDRTKTHCRQRGTRLALWAYDSATEYPIIQRCASAYDLVYTYEPADLELLSRYCSPRFLPMAFDDRFYCRHADIAAEKDIDISFVGGIDLYPQRVRLLRRISKEFRGRNISVWTDSAHWYSHRRVKDALSFGTRRNIEVHRQTLDHKAINDIYNRSRVCLNIHHTQSVKALNPRTFEILGSGGLLVTDRALDQIQGFEDGDGYVRYSDDSDLVEKLRTLFLDDGESSRIADIGHSRVRAHTYQQRARQIMADLR